MILSEVAILKSNSNLLFEVAAVVFVEPRAAIRWFWEHIFAQLLVVLQNWRQNPAERNWLPVELMPHLPNDFVHKAIADGLFVTAE